MATKEYAQVRIYKRDRDWLAVQAKKGRTTIGEVIRLLIKG